jgi:hypothetical protein
MLQLWIDSKEKKNWFVIKKIWVQNTHLKITNNKMKKGFYSISYKHRIFLTQIHEQNIDFFPQKLTVYWCKIWKAITQKDIITSQKFNIPCISNLPSLVKISSQFFVALMNWSFYNMYSDHQIEVLTVQS